MKLSTLKKKLENLDINGDYDIILREVMGYDHDIEEVKIGRDYFTNKVVIILTFRAG